MPAAPSIQVVAGSGKVNYTITDPDGATGVTGYKVSYKLTTASGAWVTKEAASKTGEIIGLINESEYQFKAQAANENGYSEFSETVKATPTEG